MKKICVSAIALAMFSSSVLAGNVASITDFSGKVLVNKGKGFVPAFGAISLGAGDKVMVGEDSFAVLSYADCAVSLAKPTVVTIAEAACDAAPANATLVQPTADAYTAPVFPWPLILLGGAAVIGGGLIIGGAFDDNSNPISGP
jgi:hypothetical protein